MLHVVPRQVGANAAPLAEDAPWRRDLDDLNALLQDSRSRGPSLAEVAALIEAEAPGALPAASRLRIAARLARILG
ncbi:hypothetical protein [Methylobacterium platani]|uniref:Uncharacterized protein n=2 Tax=Methylobacterium platani TaxID=427683 RepID=A0A179S6R0_9HYPH|nr:hypothetical protein [Methylobacterium platani]KMO22287.1 hypothetical protein SQ03_00745 [Methylobacterium platani JCM 14648]OAS22577.1 hypothetical protein A5481_19490 [Methylobacterium platani]